MRFADVLTKMCIRDSIVVNFLLAYVAAGKTVLMSTHHQDLVRRLGARAIYIDRYHHVVEAPSPSYGTESGATD